MDEKQKAIINFLNIVYGIPLEDIISISHGKYTIEICIPSKEFNEVHITDFNPINGLCLPNTM
jgi:hypothetical protein